MTVFVVMIDDTPSGTFASMEAARVQARIKRRAHPGATVSILKQEIE